MGNYPACLSSDHFHHYCCSAGDHHRPHHHPDLLAIAADDLSCSNLPLLSLPVPLDSNPQPTYVARHAAPAAVPAPGPSTNQQLPGTKQKNVCKPVMKKVRFADEVLLITSATSHAEQYVSIAPLISSPSKEPVAEFTEELLDKKKISNIYMDQSSRGGGRCGDERSHDTCMDQSSRGNNERSPNTKTVRLKVVISKKELTQLLMSSPNANTPSSPQSDALMGRILSPLLLSSQRPSFHKSQSLINSHQAYGIPYTWRPPLHLAPSTILEDVNPIELAA